MTALTKATKVAVVRTGAMGAGIAQIAAAAGFWGRKSGHGFYDYRPDATNPAPNTAPDARATVDAAGPILVRPTAKTAIVFPIDSSTRICQKGAL